jgi:beta-ketodecanoyl-[acyl-carrier-protein] synthase
MPWQNEKARLHEQASAQLRIPLDGDLEPDRTIAAALRARMEEDLAVDWFGLKVAECEFDPTACGWALEEARAAMAPWLRRARADYEQCESAALERSTDKAVAAWAAHCTNGSRWCSTCMPAGEVVCSEELERAMPMPIAITGTGLYTPPQSISNDELVAAFNAYALAHNAQNASAIASGEMKAVEPSSAEFIENASGIRRRYVMDRAGVLDPEILAPRIRERSNDEPSIQCEMAIAAAREALAEAQTTPDRIGAVIVACSNLARPYPAISVELQAALGTRGFAFDMNVACSSATFAISMARDLIQSGTAKAALVVSPEICTGHLNFRDRESHFIFGDACTAVVVEELASTQATEVYRILGTRLATKYSNNIRNNGGFLNRAAPEHRDDADKLFVQRGRKVFKDVSPMVADLISSHIDSLGIVPAAIRRMWLHQANGTMNEWIARKVLGRDATCEEAPSVLEEYANTSSCGSIITFHKHRRGLLPGDIGLICSFGAGYSIGSIIVQKGLDERGAQN